MAEEIVGTLYVHVERGREIGPPRKGLAKVRSAQDPYIIAFITSSDQHRIPAAVGGDRTPSWESREPLAIAVPATVRPVLHVDVLDQCLVGGDKHLGRAAIPFAPLLSGTARAGKIHEWVPLLHEKKDSVQGEVLVKLWFVSESASRSTVVINFGAGGESVGPSPAGSVHGSLHGSAPGSAHTSTYGSAHASPAPHGSHLAPFVAAPAQPQAAIVYAPYPPPPGVMMMMPTTMAMPMTTMQVAGGGYPPSMPYPDYSYAQQQQGYPPYVVQQQQQHPQQVGGYPPQQQTGYYAYYPPPPPPPSSS
ncbi:hypothetical protein BC828DRAFT_371584 [Blastocladiella britannica]|nr:hypothetical protein BC828DRAFT_371584 [Blastocladiella britannica]